MSRRPRRSDGGQDPILIRWSHAHIDRPLTLLDHLHDIERRAGASAVSAGERGTLDLDIVCFAAA